MREMNLNGSWKLSYDGYETEITVPGAVEQVMEDRRFYGPFFYRREFKLDTVNPDASYVLKFDGVSYACRVRVNQKEAASHEGIWDTFLADVSGLVREGTNLLEVEVVKPDFDKDSPYYFRSVLFGFIPDVMMPFGGIWRDVSLLTLGRTYFARSRVLFQKEEPGKTSGILFESRLSGPMEPALQVLATITGPSGQVFEAAGAWAEELFFPVTDPVLWSPANPALYRVEIRLMKGETLLDSFEKTGGFRSVAVRDGEILLNGSPFYMRGILHWGCYPEKMTPSPSREEIRKELSTLRALGFNAVKHCLYFPPEDYYELCDEMGIVVWQELPLWLPYPNPWMVKRIYDQYPAMLDKFLPHPCTVLTSLGCELDATIDGQILRDLYQMIRKQDAQIIICDNSGSGECFGGSKEADSDIYDYHFYGELYQMEGLVQEFTRSSRKKKPWLFGEYNDCDTFRDVKGKNVWWTSPEESKNLLRLVHKGFDSDQPVYLQEEILREYGMEGQTGGLESLSVLQMREVRKFLLELTRSYEAIKGYNITVIQDTPLTTAGILDDAGETKIPAEEMKKINGDAVLCLQKELKRVWDRGADRFCSGDQWNHFSGEELRGTVVLSNQRAEPVCGTGTVRLSEGGRILYEERFACRTEAHQTTEIKQLAVPMPRTDQSLRCRLTVEIDTGEERISNDWDQWVYPAPGRRKLYVLDHSGSFHGIETFFDAVRISDRKALKERKAGEILLTTELDEEIVRLTKKGVHVVAMVRQNGFLPVKERPFYREGVKEILAHPVTDGLAHKGFAGIQFYGLGSKLCLDQKEIRSAGWAYRPLIRRVDARKYRTEDYLAELGEEPGKLIVTTLNLDGGQGSQPIWFSENRLAVYLTERICAYMEGAPDSPQ